MTNEPASSDVDSTDVTEVAVLSRLLTDAALRRRFAEDPARVAEELTSDTEQLAFLSSLDATQLEAQAETLIGKRRHEVAQILPQTWRQLGTAAADLFQSFVDASPWPEGHRRHLVDADAFAGWLVEQTPRRPIQSEWNRIRFILSARRMSVNFVRDRPGPCGLQILWRHRNGRLQQWFPRVSLPGRQ